MYGRARFMFLPTLIQVQNENKQKKGNFKNHLGFMRLVIRTKKHKDYIYLIISFLSGVKSNLCV